MKHHREINFHRREFLTTVTGILFVQPSTALAIGKNLAPSQQPPITTPNAPFSRALDFARLKDWITPNDEFFIRSHFGVPKLDPSHWNLTVSGAGTQSRVFSLPELMKLPRVEQAVTLECAGNLVGWGGVSNARWTGIRLSSLLEPMNLSQAREIVLIGADGGSEREAGGIQIDAYARSIPLAKALDSNTMLVFGMNGDPLPADHGGPLRAINPGWYAMDSVKWLKQILVSREPFKGFYQLNRYYEGRSVNGAVVRGPLGAVRLKSQIARPVQNAVFPWRYVSPRGIEENPHAAMLVEGSAWCGDAEVRGVELSFDGGQSWKTATLGSDRARFAWRLWSYNWTPERAGRYEIMVRASDERGRVQPLERDPGIVTPYANDWVDRRIVEIR